jgi:1-acyl-sn-glycerol-3-phosphate acyltransferase
MKLDRLLLAAAAPTIGVARMAAAAATDVVDMVGGDGDDDPFARRDPDYIRDTLATLAVVSEGYFRSEVRGLERIPAEGPVLLVGNHSGGTLIADTFVFGEAFYRYFGVDRLFHQLAHDMVFKVPGVRAMLGRYGTVPAAPENMRRALDAGAALLVYPGGDHETYRPSWESSTVDFAQRTGFARLAIETGTTIVPVVAIGGQETALFLGQGGGAAKLLGLDKLFRIKVLPAQLAPPFGFSVLDLPPRIPLPAKITIQVLEPIDLVAELGEDADPDLAYDLVTGRMQEALSELADERTLPVIG